MKITYIYMYNSNSISSLCFFLWKTNKKVENGSRGDYHFDPERSEVINLNFQSLEVVDRGTSSD